MDAELIVSLLPLLLLFVVVTIPTLSLCRRTGKSRWLVLFAILPGLGPIILLFVFAYSRWSIRPQYDIDVLPPASS